MKESEKRLVEQGRDECGGKLEAASDGKEFCRVNRGSGQQLTGSIKLAVPIDGGGGRQ